MKLQNITFFWKKLRKNWSHRFSIIIRNEKNLSDVFVLRLTPRKIFVLGVSISLLIIILTAMLIAFTPLRVYVPGYTNPVEYDLYRKMLSRVDSIERMNAMQKVYLDNFYNVLNDIVVSKEMNEQIEGVSEKRIKDKDNAEKAAKQVNNAAEQLLIEIADRSTKNYIPLSQHIAKTSFGFTMPTLGVVTKSFSIQERHLGIDIENEKGTLITAIADGVVISIEPSKNEGNILIIQHSGNIVSLFKNVDKVFKSKGAKIKSGDPIATMGDKGTEAQYPYLHFEIWYNGAPINPLDYFVGGF
jgi:murein DD-endopeptidase MepM/ murein hydrolase activator NlpD